MGSGILNANLFRNDYWLNNMGVKSVLWLKPLKSSGIGNRRLRTYGNTLKNWLSVAIRGTEFQEEKQLFFKKFNRNTKVKGLPNLQP